MIQDRESIARITAFLAAHGDVAGSSIRTLSSAPLYSIDVEGSRQGPFHYEVGCDWMKVKSGSSQSLVKVNLLEMRRFCRSLEASPAG